ncbi:MAG: glycosyltransferase [Microcoleaceae cyanobacterium]
MSSLISVIIPVYNGETTICETIQSVLNQTYSNFELLIINDGSTDNTLEMISSFEDSRIQVFSYENAGQGASRNRGLKQAKGEYVSFIDADDLWTVEKLEDQITALQQYPEAAVAYSWTDYVTELGEFISHAPQRLYQGNVYARLLLSDFIGSGSNVLIRKSAILELNGFDQSLPPAEDWDMWLRLAARYPFTVVPKPQILYRVSPHSSSFNVLKMEAASLRVIERAITQSPQPINHLKSICLANRYKYLTWKTLEGIPTQKNSLIAARFLFSGVRYDASLLQTRTFIKALLKIIITGLFPAAINQNILNKLGKFSDITTILGYIQIEPPAIKELN